MLSQRGYWYATLIKDNGRTLTAGLLTQSDSKREDRNHSHIPHWLAFTADSQSSWSMRDKENEYYKIKL